MTAPGAEGGAPGPEDVVDAEVVTENAAEAGAAQAPAEEAGGIDERVAELTEALQRERAQFVNFRRRSAEEAQQKVALGKQSIVEKLLPLLDDFDRAREHGHLSDGPLKAFADKLGDVLGGEKVAKFGAPGDRFDPELHEAIQNDGSGVDPVIGQVFRPGYRLGDKVIRHAMVTVTDPDPAAGAAGTPENA
ncbi:nucleotide exchange factor GrpE [Gordonia sp. (in: high G+C Gram-positive bacteria)]|uniref:nucleotide exchange factor GrpE n=1 Tax=Gordonia sp. (in: high G+C Gram-positive bacteria) TaxID=84139 RepID=UPI003527D042